MMKIMMAVMFMNFMILKNKFFMFYYNLSYILVFIMMLKYMFKDLSISIMVSMNYSLNNYSFWMVVLSVWILSLILMCMKEDFMKLVMFLFLMEILLMFFSYMDLLYFYMAFEISMIPIFFLVIYWGSNLERVSASYYLMIYMMLISFPLLLYILKVYNFGGSFKFSILEFYMVDYKIYFLEMIMIYGAFLIKLPMYFFHMWLPKAHVEASVEGSMILAGVLLKMGGYGLIRIMSIFLSIIVKYSYLFMSIGVVGGVLVSMLCMNQIDMKMLIAYSSVVHMNSMLAGMMTLSKAGILSSLIIMVSHGICSSGLFYMVSLCYKMSGSRLLMMNKGIVGSFTLLTMWWFVLCCANFSFPFSLNFMGEVLMLMSLLNYDLMFMMIMMFICFFCSVYSLHLYIYLQHGSNLWVKSEEVIYVKEFMVMSMHVVSLSGLMLNLGMFM